jgi:N-acetylglucosamine kinase-like BadF-type ATPase
MEEGWGPATLLRARLLEASGAASANELLHQFYTIDWARPRIAALAPLVDECAVAGDPVAVAILNRAGQELATFAGAVRRQLFRDEEQPRVAYVGGVFRSDFVRERFCLLAGENCGPPELGPASGALLEAFRLAGISIQLRNVPDREK